MMAEHCRDEIEVPTTAVPTIRPAPTTAPAQCYESSGDRAATTVLEPEVDNPDWGQWGSAQFCPGNSFVRSVRVKYQESQGGGDNDDTGVNGLELECSDGCMITSAVAEWGEWTPNMTCPGTNENGFMDKLNFRSSGNLGQGLGDNDDTGADGFRWCCTVGWGWITAAGGYTGAWNAPINCPANHAIYGLQTKVARARRDDQIGLVTAKFFCAPVNNI